jgi:hypothetical protein
MSIDSTVPAIADPPVPPPKFESERKQARRENFRLLIRRPSFIIGFLILVFWVVCAPVREIVRAARPAGLP